MKAGWNLNNAIKLLKEMGELKFTDPEARQSHDSDSDGDDDDDDEEVHIAVDRITWRIEYKSSISETSLTGEAFQLRIDSQSQFAAEKLHQSSWFQLGIL